MSEFGGVFALADAFTDRRYRLLVLLAVFCSLHWGELAALSRYCVDTATGIISVRVAVVELARGQLVTGPPKTAAGNRDVTIPAFLLPDLTRHLADFTADGPRALVFTGPQGAQLRRGKRAQAELRRSGTRQEDGIVTATLMISEKSRCLRVRCGGA